MLKYYIINLLCFTFCLTTITAQSNTTFNKIATTESNPEWLQIKQNERVSKIAFTQQVKEIFELNNETELQTLKTQTDTEGWTHHRLQQTYQGIPIEDGQYILHEKNGVIHKANGNLIKNIDITTTPTLSEIDALETLLQNVNANEYAWQNENIEALLQHQLNDAAATYYPTGKLCLINPQEDKQAQNYQLAYQFDIYCTNPHNYHSYYVDAHTGNIIDEIPLICHAQGTASTNYYGNQTFTTEFDNGLYYLKDNNRNIETYSANNEDDFPLLDIVSTDNNSWTTNTQKTGSEAHWIAQETYDYFLNIHNLNGYNGFGGKLMIWVNYGLNEKNAFAYGGKIWIGDGDGVSTNPLTTIDIVSHEYTHNIIQHSSALKPLNESGALNESFADIFGTVLEKQLDPNNFDWNLGEDAFLSSNAFRSMSDPNLYNDPDTYKGAFWYSGTNDHGGIHTNSGVQNYWFYLLSEGGNGTNDNGQSYNITGIGMDKAANIAYRNMTIYLNKNSNYIEARNGSIQAATDLYGANSTEVQQVKEAWCAVGVGVCNSNIDGTLTLTSPNGSETLNQGIPYNITWSNTGNTGNNVTLKYSIDGGSTWQTITNETPNDGSYTWTTPPFSTTIALVEITANDNNAILDKSNNHFTINSCDVNPSFTTSLDTICLGQTVTFTNQSTGPVNSFKWYINDSQISTSTNLTYTFTQAGTYTVELYALKGTTCLNIYKQEIKVYDINPNFTFAPVATNRFKFTAPSSNPLNSTYLWTVDGTILGSSNQEFYTYTIGGTYTVCLDVTNTCGGTLTSCQPIDMFVLGCTDFTASNYDSNANQDDGSCVYPTPCATLAADSLALVALYNNVNGPNWTNTWNLSQPIYTWYGITLSSDGCSVDKINLSDNNLSGFLPTELVSLSNLTYLDLSDNSNLFDTANYPSLDLLTNLTYLDLNDNNLTHIHTNLGMMANLTYLDISRNSLLGNIPTNLGNFGNLTYLNLSNNSLTGNIPTELGNLSNLTQLFLHTNQLDGTIPTELGSLNTLTHLYLYSNELSGNIPPELGNLSNLIVLLLNMNQVTGHIPPELGNLSNLISLYFNSNQLSGPIPPELGNLSNLINLSLYGNNLSENIPAELGNLGNLSVLLLNSNQLNGPIPPELGSLNNLTMLWLSYNQLSGAIPVELGDLGNLNTLNLASNQLSGCYPPKWCNINWDFSDFSCNNNPDLPNSGSDQGFQDLCAGTVAPCEDDPVYPGDFNFDGVADHRDVVTYGLHFGEMGIARVAQDINWTNHESRDWGILQENSFDVKHVDGDGNGVVDLEDMQALENNYGNTHTASPLSPPVTSITDSPIEIYLQPAVVPSFSGNDNIVELDVMIANTQGGGDLSLYGTSFNISYLDNGLIDTVAFELNNSWLGNVNQDLQYIVHNDEANQTLEIGITRIDHANALGDGPIGKVTACINNITPWDSLTLAFDVEQIFASNSEAVPLPIATNYTELPLVPNEPCANNLIIDPATNFQNTYEAANLIETIGDVIIQNGQSVEMRSSEGLLNDNFEVKLGGDLYVTYDPCNLGNKPTVSSSTITKKVAKDITYNKDKDKINIDYLLKTDANVSMAILTMDKQLIERIGVGQTLAGQQQLSIDRANLPAGQLWICLKQGRERYYFSIEN